MVHSCKPVIETERNIFYIKKTRTRHMEYVAKLKITSKDICCASHGTFQKERYKHPGLYSGTLIIN